jgi:hypothetical protein
MGSIRWWTDSSAFKQPIRNPFDPRTKLLVSTSREITLGHGAGDYACLREYGAVRHRRVRRYST